ncbi:Myb/SANT-like domain-containing protein [Arachis hypogaea]|nr:Myb/SANT-like domain-containing protein [Arachis hypogaea]
MDRHVWTDEETETFVGFMEELVSKGRMADAGQFKPGSFEKLDAKMNERFSGSGFQISHCKNKVKRLKEKYQFAADIVACNSFGWDDMKQCMVVDNEEILAAYMKDRTNGVAAVCGNDAEEKVQHDRDEEVDAEYMDMFNSNHDFNESLLQQSNSVSSSSEKK